MNLYKDLYLFNPSCEMAVANGGLAWKPSQLLEQFEEDLQFLMVLFSTSDDLLICKNNPSSEFLASIDWIPGSNCTFDNLQNLNRLVAANRLKINRIKPWGASPAMHHLLRGVKNCTSEEYRRSLIFNWKPELKTLFSRVSALDILQRVLILENRSKLLLPETLIPKVVYSIEEVEQLFSSWCQLVLKSPWSSSGRGVQFLRLGYLNMSNRQWILSILKQQGYLIVEPLLDKKLDFSLHFYISDEGICPLGISTFRTNSNGQYMASDISPNYALIESFISVGDLQKMLQTVLFESGVHKIYEGYIGVDLMVVDIDGKTVIHPCVEINWRYNMGLVALRLGQLLTYVEKGFFSIHISQSETFGEFSEQMRMQYPPIFKYGFPFKGFFPLSDFNSSVSGAYILLGES